MLIEIPKRIETQRLYLRSYEVGDGPMLHTAGLRNQEHLSRYEFGNFLLHFKDEDHAETIIQELAAGWMERNCFFFGIFEKETDDWAGQVYVGPADWALPEFVIGYIADVDHEGLGYITESVKTVTRMLFEEIRAHRVRADCNETNIRSWHLLERCGFKREGHLRENKMNPDGSYHGDYLYAMLKTDFFNRSF